MNELEKLQAGIELLDAAYAEYDDIWKSGDGTVSVTFGSHLDRQFEIEVYSYAFVKGGRREYFDSVDKFVEWCNTVYQEVTENETEVC